VATRLLDEPTRRMRGAGEDGEDASALDAARSLFGLAEGDAQRRRAAG
jgi:hypothetical protein